MPARARQSPMPEKSRRNEKKFGQSRLKQISENALHIILKRRKFSSKTCRICGCMNRKERQHTKAHFKECINGAQNRTFILHKTLGGLTAKAQAEIRRKVFGQRRLYFFLIVGAIILIAIIAFLVKRKNH
jgi:hypothetical protein